jgi:hypothetical protein
MASTYDPALPTDKDWVRFLIGDKNTPDSVFSDEEIFAALTEWPGKYCAAANLLSANRAALLTTTGGVTSKSVGNLSISYGSATQSPESALTDLIDRLMGRCLNAATSDAFLKIYSAGDC